MLVIGWYNVVINMLPAVGSETFKLNCGKEYTNYNIRIMFFHLFQYICQLCLEIIGTLYNVQPP